MHKHSIETFNQIVSTLPKSRARVFEVIKRKVLITRQSIAVELDLPINSITGRVKELLETGMIEEDGRIKINGKSRATLRVVRPDPHQQKLL